MTEGQPVIIIGAGVSGLAFAQGLLQASIPFRIFERGPKVHDRDQGYRFRMQIPGASALREVLTAEHFERVQAACPPIITDKHGPAYCLDATTVEEGENAMKGVTRWPKFHPAKPGFEVSKPINADRTLIRTLLLDGLDDYITFEKAFSSYDITSTGVTVSFADGSKVEGSLVVGADGSRSRVRRQFLPQAELVDTEGRMIYGKTALTPDVLENFNPTALTGMGVIQDLAHDPMLTLFIDILRFPKVDFMDQPPKDYLYWVLMARKDKFQDDATMLNMNAEETAALVRKITSHWHPSVHPLFRQENLRQTTVIKVLSARPEIPVWEPSGRVTLIGDAIHAMSPTSGSGATTAVRDAANLVDFLREGGINATSVGKYEALMREYAGDVISTSEWASQVLFGMKPFSELETATI